MIRKPRPRKRRRRPPKGGGGNPPAVPPAANFTVVRDAGESTITFFTFDQPVTYAGTFPAWSVFANPPRHIIAIAQGDPLTARVTWSGSVSVGQSIDCGNGSRSWRTQQGGAIVGGRHVVAASP